MGRWLALLGAGLVTVVVMTAAALATLPMPTLESWAIGMLVLEFSLVVAGIALAGVVLALVAARGAPGRWRRIGAGTVGVLNAVVLIAGVLPAISAWSTAREHGASLRLSGYLSGLSSTAEREPDDTVRYAYPDGTDLMLDVWQPKSRDNDELRPAVINVHGGAEDAPQSPFPRWDTWLADSGYVVFDVDYRFFQPYDWQTPPGDVKCALGWVARNAERYGADPDQLTLMGQSADGYLALLAAYTTATELPPSCDAPEAELDGVIAWYAPGDAAAEIPPTWRLSESVRRQLNEEAWQLTDEDRE